MRPIIVAAQHRSGSTHISHVLARAYGLERRFFSHWDGNDVSNMQVCPHQPLEENHVYHQHMFAAPADMIAIGDVDPAIIVTTRNIYNSVRSLQRTLAHDHTGGVKGAPGLFVTEDYNKLSESGQMDWTIDHAVPWAAQFVVSWELATCWHWNGNPVRVHWVDYDEHFADEKKSFKRMFEFIGGEPDMGTLYNTLMRFTFKKSTGTARKLSWSQKRRVRQIISTYAPELREALERRLYV